MSPLAEAIYQILGPRVGLADPLISYHELVKQLPPLDPPFADLARNDPRLFQALGEVGKACQDRGLPVLTALVIRSAERTPGAGYFQTIHPEASGDPAGQADAWRRELAGVQATEYPPSLDASPGAATGGPPQDRRRARPLGHLRLAQEDARPPVVFRGRLTCPRCARELDVEVERNPTAVSPKQPAFLMAEVIPGGRPLGHLFIGTLLSSPVLYYGTLNHCGTEQRLAVFYNRALRDRSDPHLIVMPALSASPTSTVDEAEAFRLA